MRRLEQERRKAKAQATRTSKKRRRARGRQARTAWALSFPVPDEWMEGRAERFSGPAVAGIGDLLKIKTEKKLFLPSGETADD